MIVRIMADNQYRIADDDISALNEIERLDGKLVEAVESDDAATFHAALVQLIAHVRQAGRPLSEEELAPSDMIVPPADLTLAETRRVLALSAVTGR